jgi:ABC-type Zn uptake system ZnuABC Zn-binding protein ZnuA
MARFGVLFLVVVVGFAGVWLLILNGRRGAAPVAKGSGGRLVVVASVPALGLAANRLMGSAGECRVLLDAGADPTVFVPGEKALDQFKGAALLIVTGNELDAWAVEAAKKAGRGDIPVIRLSDVMVYGVPPPGSGGATTRPGGHLTGKERTVDALGRAFVKKPEPYVAEKTPVVSGKEVLWLDTVYAQLFVNELSARLQELLPREERNHVRDRARLLGNTLISLHGAYEYRFGRLKDKRLRVTDNTLAPMARRYGLSLELIPCVQTGEAGYTHGLPTTEGLAKLDKLDKRPIFTVAGPGLDLGVFRGCFNPLTVVVLNPMTDSTDVAEPDFEVLCKQMLDAVYGKQVEAVGVR